MEYCAPLDGAIHQALLDSYLSPRSPKTSENT